jgi:P-type Ca2+ transporter type 2C
MMNWHTVEYEEILQQLETSPQGLSVTEAQKRLGTHGRNELLHKKVKPPWLMFMLQFRDVMILILVGAATVSALAGDLKDTIVILVIIVLNAVAGFIQEYRAEKALAALKKLSASPAKVMRDEKLHHVSSSDIVPGDIVILEAGDMVPADVRIIEQHTLKIDESSLTGESQAVEKTHGRLSDLELALGDRKNMAYKNSLVTYGRGVGLVVATGMKTEMGAIAKMLQDAESQTPLQKRLSDFSRKLSIAVLGICAVIYAAGLLRGEDPLQMLLIAISVAVAAVPEALPAVITVALALGAKRMVRKNVLIRKLPAVETLGSVTFICTDKTGTLTQNKMTVTDVWAPDKPDFLLLAMSLNHDAICNEKGEWSGDPTEVALARYAADHAADDIAPDLSQRRVFELPFDSDRKMMTTVHELQGKLLVITKGALEPVLNNAPGANALEAVEWSNRMASSGRRVLAYSYKIIDPVPADVLPGLLETDQVFCGLAGMIDPPRPEAQKAVDECITAGILPVMITGDHPVTARAIASALGILRHPGDLVVTGLELEKLSPHELEDGIRHIKVYARVSAAQKLQIVKALQHQHEFVAMTGDGVNDSPALKQANIGIAMGITGTDVSKEAAHMILLDDNFATIVKAVREGRRIFDNIRKFIRYILTGNSAEIWVIFLAPLGGLPIPLLPIHILWINLVTDGLPGLALAGEPAEKNIMLRPPRPPQESIFSGGLGYHVLWVGLLMAGICLAVQAGAINAGNNKWQTMVFTVLCFSQMAHVLAIRSERASLLQQGLLSNFFLAGAVMLTFLLQLAILYVPLLQEVFSTRPLTLPELAISIAASLIVLVAVEAEKLVRRKRALKSGA